MPYVYTVRSGHNGEEAFLVGSTPYELPGVTPIGSTTAFARLLECTPVGQHFQHSEAGQVVDYAVVDVSLAEPPEALLDRVVADLAADLQALDSDAILDRLDGAIRDYGALLGRDDFWNAVSAGPTLALVLLVCGERFLPTPEPPCEPYASLLREFVRERRVVAPITGNWSALAPEVRARVARLAVQRRMEWPDLHQPCEHETDAACTCLLVLKLLQAVPVDPESGFRILHDVVEKVVIERSDGERPPDMRLLLPTCPTGRLRYCEAQIEPDAPSPELRWCRDRWCNRSVAEPDSTRQPRSWRLPDLMSKLELSAPSDVVSDAREYSAKLGGWLNRLHEVHEHLLCRSCRRAMAPHWSYARRRARYHTTVFRCVTPGCPENGLDNPNKCVYLNHCCGCEEVIDSRDCRLSRSGMYVCQHCGVSEAY